MTRRKLLSDGQGEACTQRHLHDPPQMLQGVPRCRACDKGMLMQFRVHWRADLQLAQWYLCEDVLKATISSETAGWLAAPDWNP
jgi:hypothetical protein